MELPQERGPLLWLPERGSVTKETPSFIRPFAGSYSEAGVLVGTALGVAADTQSGVSTWRTAIQLIGIRSTSEGCARTLFRL